VSDYAPRTRRDRECCKARTSAPDAAAGLLAPCASGVCDACDARTPLVVTPMQAVSAGPRRAPRSILLLTPSSYFSLPHARANSRRRRRRGVPGDRSEPVNRAVLCASTLKTLRSSVATFCLQRPSLPGWHHIHVTGGREMYLTRTVLTY
jgi:hypothetical protein